jgi:serine/threonine protein kinase
MSFHPPEPYIQQVGRQYLSMLAESPAIALEQYLGDAPEIKELETVVKADMSFRWQKLNFAGPVEVEQATFVKPPNVESYAERFAALGETETLRRLVKWELSLRREIGDRPTIVEYANRFPQLGDAEEWLADEFEPGQRSRGGDRRIGATVGSFRIESKVGEGPLTVSYLAVQYRPVRQSVVVKFVKTEFDSSEVLGRFRFECPSLACMDSKHVVNAFDADRSPEGTTYFVMPYVEGVDLTEYARENALELPKRIELFLDVCDAVQHAHVKGVMHQDLKPSNLLVSQAGDTPVVQVVDFGVARAIGNRLGKRAVISHFNDSLQSLQYISPEQASFNPSDIDTRSDVYSLGAVLYELVTGQPPFSQADLGAGAIDQTLRVIRQDRPSVPSERAAGLPVGLDWIVMKALAKEREQRYQSPRDFADDLRRYQQHKPVSAAPDSRSYRLRKFVEKNWLAIGIGLLLQAVLLVIVATAT